MKLSDESECASLLMKKALKYISQYKFKILVSCGKQEQARISLEGNNRYILVVYYFNIR